MPGSTCSSDGCIWPNSYAAGVGPCRESPDVVLKVGVFWGFMSVGKSRDDRFLHNVAMDGRSNYLPGIAGAAPGKNYDGGKFWRAAASEKSLLVQAQPPWKLTWWYIDTVIIFYF